MRPSRAAFARLALPLCGCWLLSAGLAARAEGAATRLPAGTDPEAVAFDAARAMLFVVNKGDDTVSVIDRVHATTSTVAVGHLPVAIAFDPERNVVYVVNSGSDSVTRVDGATLATSTIAVGHGPNAIALDAATNVVFVVNNGDSSITRIDGATLGTSQAAVGNNPVAVALDPVGQKVVVANRGSNSVTLLSETLSGAQTQAVGQLPSAIAIDPRGGFAYILNSGDTTLAQISTNSSVPFSVGTVALAGHPVTIALEPSLRQFAVGFSDSDSVQLFDALFGTTRLAQFGAPATALAFDAQTGRLYAAHASNQAVSVLDAGADPQLLVAGVNSPAALVVDPLRARAYCLENNAFDVVEIDGTHYTRSEPPLGRLLTFAVDPVANEVYAANNASIAVINGTTLSSRTLGVSVSYGPQSMAANTATHKLYATTGSSRTAVIDLDAGTTNNVTTGYETSAVTVNPANGRTYVLDFQHQVFVLDSDDTPVATIPVGNNPYAIAVDPVANRIFVSNDFDSTLSVIDGHTNAVSTLPMPGYPISASPEALVVFPDVHTLYVGTTNGLYAVDTVSLATTNTGIQCSNSLLAGNPLTKTLYCVQNSNVLVINGGVVSTQVPIDNFPQAIAVDPVLDKIYVAHYKSQDVEVIDGATNSYDFNTIGDIAYNLGIDPMTQNVFVAGGAQLYLLSPAQGAAAAVVTSVVPLTHNIAVAPNVTLTLQTAVVDSHSTGYQAQHVYYQLDSRAGTWTEASGGPGTGPYTAELSGLSYGTHILFTYATDGTEASTSQPGKVSTTAGAIAAYAFIAQADVVFADGFE
jgi:YVTN family beta-propeller protein